MVVPNLYWPVYKNLEKEFLQLSDYIHFCDEQMKVYSMHIADLIVRCSIEIEALSKELYNLLGGNMAPVDEQGNKRDLYFDTDCLDLLEQKWHLGKKEITVSATTFYFTEEKTNDLLRCIRPTRGVLAEVNGNKLIKQSNMTAEIH